MVLWYLSDVNELLEQVQYFELLWIGNASIIFEAILLTFYVLSLSHAQISRVKEPSSGWDSKLQSTHSRTFFLETHPTESTFYVLGITPYSNVKSLTFLLNTESIHKQSIINALTVMCKYNGVKCCAADICV